VGPTDDALQLIEMGMGLATFDAITAGSLPSPTVVSDRPMGDWVYLDRRIVAQGNTEIMQPTYVQQDIRAQRKLAGGNLFVIFNSENLLTAIMTVRLRGLCRCLYLRP